jgi:chromosome segregation ATPase
MDPIAIGTIIGAAISAFISTLIARRGKKEAKQEAEQSQQSFMEKYAEEARQREIRQREEDAERITSREKRIEKLETDMDELSQQREADAAKIAALEAQNVTDRDAAQKRMGELEAELAQLRRRVEDLDKENERLKKERDAGQERERQLQAKVEKQEHEIAELNRRIAILEAEKGVLERLFDKLDVVKVQVKTDEAANPPAPTESKDASE